MAIIRGKAGRYTGEKTARLRRRFLLLAIVMVGVLGVGEGVTLSSLWAKWNPPGWLTATVQWGGLVAIGVMAWWGLRKMDELEAERIKWQKGDEGETAVGKVLANFPDDFHVINDISTPSGNLDHVVVGPPGVFVLDAKNWRGLVQADGSGELLLNGKRLDKDYARQFIGRIMGVKERVSVRAPEVDAYFRGVFVFTTAYVEAKWGTTGAVHCMTEQKLGDYIVENKYGKRLTPAEVEKIAQAFLGLAHMDRDFTDQAMQAPGHKPLQADAAPTPKHTVANTMN